MAIKAPRAQDQYIGVFIVFPNERKRMKKLPIARLLALAMCGTVFHAFADEPSRCRNPNDPASCTAAGGRADARDLLARGKKAVLVPDILMPKSEFDIAVAEFAKLGIEYRVMGDVDQEGLEQYRAGFNEVMREALRRAYGEGIFDEVDRRIHERVRAEDKAGRTPQAPRSSM